MMESSTTPTINTNHGTTVINSLNEDTARYIAAGEKISDIEAAVRELIENSVDALATKIEIRLRDFGTTLIEVEDDGVGVKESDFDNLASRYCTSKISGLESLKSLTTFGFRGEALSCLCASADVTIVTKDNTAPTGTKLEFNVKGEVKKKTITARDRGTTVSVRDLFKLMPARRKDLERNAKKQYDRIVRLVYEHTLARPHIRFTLCKLDGMKKEKDFVHGGTTLETCIIGIFGTKTMNSLIPFKQSIPKDESPSCSQTFKTSLAKFKYNSTDAASKKLLLDAPKFEVSGYISKSDLSSGKNSKECQFLFVNRKPCDLPKLTKTINGVYELYNKNQYPFFCLFVSVQDWAVDFNVPRKRAIIMINESNLCDLIKLSLDEMYVKPNITKSETNNAKNLSFHSGFVSANRILRASNDALNASSESSKQQQENVTFSSSAPPACQRSPSPDPNTTHQHPERETTASSSAPIIHQQTESAIISTDTTAEVLVATEATNISSADVLNNLEIERARDSEFSAAINPDLNSVAEEELKASLNKESFEKMVIIGQFNRGFIITKLDNHLFIIDQHASDERYNYEDQLSHPPIVRQPLVHPKPLYLNSMQEKIIEEHKELFERKGLSFNIDMSKPPGTRVSLSATSICKGLKHDIHLSKEDIEELIGVILESPNRAEDYILTKVKTLSASRACRKSVMIGSPLDHGQMKEIVMKMGSLKNPWICAHGRPTIRHLLNSNWLNENKAKKKLQDNPAAPSA